MEGHAIKDPAAARTFVLGGNATVTLKSTATGRHFTFRVRAPRGDKTPTAPRFVQALTGPNNEGDFEFLGTIFSDDHFVIGRKSRISAGAPTAVAFGWAWRKIAAGELPDGLEVWHDGRCGCCGRTLTVPESIETGFGPVCAERHAR